VRDRKLDLFPTSGGTVGTSSFFVGLGSRVNFSKFDCNSFNFPP
jgi:hypothetical protein